MRRFRQNVTEKDIENDNFEKTKFCAVTNTNSWDINFNIYAFFIQERLIFGLRLDVLLKYFEDISASNVLEIFLNIIVGCAGVIFHPYKPTGSTRTFIN